MLQIAAHDGKDPDAVGEPGHPRPQAADAAHVHSDVHPGLAGLGQLVDQLPVGDRVALEENAGGPAAPGLGGFSVDQGDEPVLQAVGGHQQVAVFPLQVGGGHILKEGGGVRPDGRIGRHQAQVGIELGGLFIVVAGAHLGDVLYVAPLPARDKTDFGVDLDPLEAVLNGAARLLQPLGPGDVVLLVEPGPQLHQHRHVLAVFGGRRQVFDELGLGGQAVDGDLDRQHRRVVGGLLHQLKEGVHGVVGVVEQGVPPQDLGDELFAPVEAHGEARGEGGEAQGGGALRGQLILQGVNVAHADGGLGAEHLLPGQVQPLAQEGEQRLVGSSLDLQPDRGQPGALFEYLTHVLAEVAADVVVLILRGDIGVAGDRDHRLAHHLVLIKNLSGVLLDNLLDEQVAQPPLAELEEGGQALGDGHDAEILPLPPAQGHGHVEGLAGQGGEGVVGVHHLGGEDGGDVIPKVPLHLLFLLGVQLRDGQTADIAGPQAGLQLADHLVPLLVERANGGEDGGELLGGGQAALGVHMGLFHQGHVVDGAHPDHKEIVQVAGEDGGELEPLEQGDGLIPGLVQHPLVEAQPGQLPLLGVAGVHDGKLRHGPHLPRTRSMR